jgi:hypothetical protein
MMVDAARPPEGGGYDALAVVQVDQAHGSLHLRTADGPALELTELPYTVAA